jgi:multidrug efflux system membrane fusion protein
VNEPGKASQAENEEGEPAPRRRWPWLVGAALVVVVAVVVATRSGKASTKAGKGDQAAARAVPVVAAPAKQGDLGVYLNGLGTATAVNTVTVRSRVDGQLVTVAFQEGQLVHAGDLLAQIDPRPFQVQLQQAEAQMAKDQATLQNANADLRRYQALIEQDAIPRQQLDTQVATVAQTQAAIQGDQAQIESAKLNLAYSRIVAPITGRVGLRLVDPGNMVHAADPNGLVVIAQVQPIAVVFTLPADRLPQVQLQKGRALSVEAWDRDLKNKLATGTLLAYDNQVDPATGTVRFKALFPNEGEELFPNQFVNARLLVDTLRGVVLVPAAAVQRSTQSTFVYVVQGGETVEARNVAVMLTEGDQVAVGAVGHDPGVAAGDQVVVDGLDKLQPGAKVTMGSGATEGVPATPNAEPKPGAKPAKPEGKPTQKPSKP